MKDENQNYIYLKKTPTRFPDFRYENFYRMYFFKYAIQLAVV